MLSENQSPHPPLDYALDQALDQTPPGPPERTPGGKTNLWQEVKDGLGYVRFVVTMAGRIRGLKNRARFIIGVILWKPILPQDD